MNVLEEGMVDCLGGVWVRRGLFFLFSVCFL